MPFPIHCEGCGASFKLSDDLFEKKVKGKSVAIRCKHCNREILVDGLHLESVPEDGSEAPSGASAEAATPTASESSPAAGSPLPDQPSDAASEASTEAATPAASESSPAAGSPLPDQPEPSASDAGTAPQEATPADQPSAPILTPTPAASPGPESTRDLSVEASLAGVFDDPNESMLPDDAVQSMREPPRGLTPARKAPSPPRRIRDSAPDPEPARDDIDVDFDFDFECLSALSAPLDLRAPSLAALVTPPTPEAKPFDQPASGKWILRPPDAALTTATDERARRKPGPLSSVSQALGTPEAVTPRSAGHRNWTAAAAVLLVALAVSVALWMVTRQPAAPGPGTTAAGPIDSPVIGARTETGAATQPSSATHPATDTGSSDDQLDAKGQSGKSDQEARPGTAKKSVTAGPDTTQPATDAKPPKALAPAAPDKPVASGTAFSREAASAALSAAAASASACRRGSDPSGTATVTVTFASSGRVVNAAVAGPPFAGTPTGGCIAATMRRAQVPPFSGSNVTVSKRVVIR